VKACFFAAQDHWAGLLRQIIRLILFRRTSAPKKKPARAKAIAGFQILVVVSGFEPPTSAL
jgi:hypothetical protein